MSTTNNLNSFFKAQAEDGFFLKRFPSLTLTIAPSSQETSSCFADFAKPGPKLFYFPGVFIEFHNSSILSKLYHNHFTFYPNLYFKELPLLKVQKKPTWMIGFLRFMVLNFLFCSDFFHDLALTLKRNLLD